MITPLAQKNYNIPTIPITKPTIVSKSVVAISYNI